MSTRRFQKRNLILVLFVSLALIATFTATTQAEDQLAAPAKENSPPPPEFDVPPHDSTPRIDKAIELMDVKLNLTNDQEIRIKKILMNAKSEMKKEWEKGKLDREKGNRTQMKPPSGGGGPGGMKGGRPGIGNPDGKHEIGSKSQDKLNMTIRAIEMVLDSDQQVKFKKMRDEFRATLSERGRGPNDAPPGQAPLNNE